MPQPEWLRESEMPPAEEAGREGLDWLRTLAEAEAEPSIASTPSAAEEPPAAAPAPAMSAPSGGAWGNNTTPNETSADAARKAPVPSRLLPPILVRPNRSPTVVAATSPNVRKRIPAIATGRGKSTAAARHPALSA